MTLSRGSDADKDELPFGGGRIGEGGHRQMAQGGQKTIPQEVTRSWQLKDGYVESGQRLLLCGPYCLFSLFPETGRFTS